MKLLTIMPAQFVLGFMRLYFCRRHTLFRVQIRGGPASHAHQRRTIVAADGRLACPKGADFAVSGEKRERGRRALRRRGFFVWEGLGIERFDGC